MAERQSMSAREIIIGIVVMAVVFFVVFGGAGMTGLSATVPQWALGAIAAVIGVVIWFAAIGRFKR